MRTACLQLCLLFGSSFVAISHQRHRVKKAPAEHTFGPSDDGKNTTKQLLTNNLLSRFIVVPEHKLIFCYIEKVACTQFNNLFNEITGGRPVYLDWPWYRNSPKVVGWSKQQLEDAIVDPAWHKAIFYREPMERFLSGYRSKCERRHDKDGANHCKKYFGRKRIAFETAVDAVASVDRKMSHAEQLAESFDVHWTRQSKYCGGLDRSLQYYDTVVRVDKNTAREEVRTMLNKSGIDASRLTKFDKLFPEGKAGNTGKNKGHVTASDAHMLEYFKTFQLTNIIKQHYVEDYRVFGIQAPSWAVDEEAFLEHQRAPQESSSRPG